MIAVDMTIAYEVDLSASPKAHIAYDAQGTWSTRSSFLSVDYTKHKNELPNQHFKNIENGSNNGYKVAAI